MAWRSEKEKSAPGEDRTHDLRMSTPDSAYKNDALPIAPLEDFVRRTPSIRARWLDVTANLAERRARLTWR